MLDHATSSLTSPVFLLCLEGNPRSFQWPLTPTLSGLTDTHSLGILLILHQLQCPFAVPHSYSTTGPWSVLFVLSKWRSLPRQFHLSWLTPHAHSETSY